uniref:Uncharacterized protein n=1 Tax=Nelumbo nucifera TaxID=4432 RepID=A0A822YC69_NELNU|nr:TPA_asm: hypothetical protein HUJ06_031515 [Nelumbo nucifera]
MTISMGNCRGKRRRWIDSSKFRSAFVSIFSQFSSFRSIDSSGSRRRGPVSAHELHYMVNRVISELKKKTFLLYKQGLLERERRKERREIWGERKGKGRDIWGEGGLRKSAAATTATPLLFVS